MLPSLQPTVLPAMRALLSAMVDYAGLFPPAKLSLRQAMANYAQYQMAPERWLLGRFVLPANQIHEFAALLPDPLTPWSLSVIAAKDWQTTIAQMQPFKNHPAIAINALEFPLLSPEAIEQVLPLIPDGVSAFFEIPVDGVDAYLKVLKHPHVAAKLRTGGVTADAFPSSEQLGKAIVALAEARVPFKATAGLHHALPATYRLTDQPGSTDAVMQGFLNVALLAALALTQAITLAEALELLQTSSIDRWQFTPDGVIWKTYRLSNLEIAASRQDFFRSFGSCSFEEPIADLLELHLL
jgi:hypothetical protein